MDLHNKLSLFSSRAKITARGFTLIELLIVILIISLVSGIAVMTISHNQKKEYEYLANSLTHLITLAEEEAMLRPATIGIGFTANSFQFFAYNKTVTTGLLWEALTDKPYGSHHFSDHIKIVVIIQNKAVPLDGKPYLIISTSGDITPFTILIGKEDETPSYQVKGYSDGSVIVISGTYHEK